MKSKSLPVVSAEATTMAYLKKKANTKQWEMEKEGSKGSIQSWRQWEGSFEAADEVAMDIG